MNSRTLAVSMFNESFNLFHVGTGAAMVVTVCVCMCMGAVHLHGCVRIRPPPSHPPRPAPPRRGPAPPLPTRPRPTRPLFKDILFCTYN